MTKQKFIATTKVAMIMMSFSFGGCLGMDGDPNDLQVSQTGFHGSKFGTPSWMQKQNQSNSVSQLYPSVSSEGQNNSNSFLMPDYNGQHNQQQASANAQQLLQSSVLRAQQEKGRQEQQLGQQKEEQNQEVNSRESIQREGRRLGFGSDAQSSDNSNGNYMLGAVWNNITQYLKTTTKSNLFACRCFNVYKEGYQEINEGSLVIDVSVCNTYQNGLAISNNLSTRRFSLSLGDVIKANSDNIIMSISDDETSRNYRMSLTKTQCATLIAIGIALKCGLFQIGFALAKPCITTILLMPAAPVMFGATIVGVPSILLLIWLAKNFKVR